MPFQRCSIQGKDVDSKAYHALKNKAPRGSCEFIQSPSSMKLFYKQPSKWKRGYEIPPAKSRRWGNLMDCRLLTPHLFNTNYAVQPATYKATVMECPSCKGQTTSKKCLKCGCERNQVTIEKPWSSRDGDCAEWKEEQIKAGKETCTAKEFADSEAAIARLFEVVDDKDDTVRRWFDASDKQVLVTGEWLDEETGIVIPVSCLIDFVPRLGTEFDGWLGDLKTCVNAETLEFTKQSIKLGYHIQGIFDLDMFNAATGEKRQDWCFITQENYSPWETNRIIYESPSIDGLANPSSVLDLGRHAPYGGYQGILSLYARCLKHNRWPGYNGHDETTQGWSIAKLDPFAASRAQFGPKMIVPGDEEEEEEAEEQQEFDDVSP